MYSGKYHLAPLIHLNPLYRPKSNPWRLSPDTNPLYRPKSNSWRLSPDTNPPWPPLSLHIYRISFCYLFGIYSQTTFCMYMCVLSCVWLFATPVDCSLPGSSVHEIFQARILEWIAIPTPEDLPDPEIEPTSPTSPALVGGSLPPSHLGSFKCTFYFFQWDLEFLTNRE